MKRIVSISLIIISGLLLSACVGQSPGESYKLKTWNLQVMVHPDAEMPQSGQQQIAAVECGSKTFCVAQDIPGDYYYFNGVNWTYKGYEPSLSACQGKTCDGPISSAFGCGSSHSCPLGMNYYFSDLPFVPEQFNNVFCTEIQYCVEWAQSSIGYELKALPKGNGTYFQSSQQGLEPYGDWVILNLSRKLFIDNGQHTSASCVNKFCMVYNTQTRQTQLVNGFSVSDGPTLPNSHSADWAFLYNNPNCQSSSFCYLYWNGTNQVNPSNTALYEFTGKNWTALPLPKNLNINSNGGQVSCSSSNFCVAIRTPDEQNSSLSVFNGHSWSPWRYFPPKAHNDPSSESVVCSPAPYEVCAINGFGGPMNVSLVQPSS